MTVRQKIQSKAARRRHRKQAAKEKRRKHQLADLGQMPKTPDKVEEVVKEAKKPPTEEEKQISFRQALVSQHPRSLMTKEKTLALFEMAARNLEQHILNLVLGYLAEEGLQASPITGAAKLDPQRFVAWVKEKQERQKGVILATEGDLDEILGHPIGR